MSEKVSKSASIDVPPMMGQGVTAPPLVQSSVKVEEAPKTIMGSGLTILQLLALIAAFYAVNMFQIPPLTVNEKWAGPVQSGSQITFGIVVYVVIYKLLQSLFGR